MEQLFVRERDIERQRCGRLAGTEALGDINKPKEANGVLHTFIQSLCVQGRTHTVRLAAKRPVWSAHGESLGSYCPIRLSSR